MAKTTLYRHFGSKDDLIVAYLTHVNEQFWAWFEASIDPAAPAHDQLVTLFDAVQKLATRQECLADALGQALDDKLVIDASNNLAGGPMNSIAVLTRHAPRAIPARGFNSLGWENFANPDFDGTTADLLWCGPDGDAGALVGTLITDIGLNPVCVGGLDQLPVVDMLASLWFALALGQRHAVISPSRSSPADQTHRRRRAQRPCKTCPPTAARSRSAVRPRLYSTQR